MFRCHSLLLFWIKFAPRIFKIKLKTWKWSVYRKYYQTYVENVMFSVNWPFILILLLLHVLILKILGAIFIQNSNKNLKHFLQNNPNKIKNLVLGVLLVNNKWVNSINWANVSIYYYYNQYNHYMDTQITNLLNFQSFKHIRDTKPPFTITNYNNNNKNIV